MNEGCRRDRRRVLAGEPGGLNKAIKVGHLVVFQRLRPTRLPDDNPIANLASVSEKFVEANNWHVDRVGSLERRRPGGISVSSLVSPFDQITGLLKFNR